MKLRWKSELRIGLSPDRTVSVRYRRGFVNEIVERSIEHFDEADSGPSWASAVQAMSRLLERTSPRVAEVSVVLSDHFVRYATLAPSPALKGEADWLAYAKHTLRGSYGSPTVEWELSLSSGGHGKPRIACGIETKLVDAVTGAALEAGIRLRSIKPQLAVVFNRHRRTLEKGGAWLAVLESGRLTLCVLAGRVLHAVRSRRTQGDAWGVLAHMLAREGLLGETEQWPARVVVCSDEPFGLPSEPTREEISVEDRTLAPRDPPELRRFALALA